MQARENHLTTHKDERPSPLFCKTLAGIISTCFPKKETMFGDGLETVRTAHTELSHAFCTLEPQMHAEEDKRKHFQVSINLYHGIRDAEHSINIYEEKLNALEVQFEKDKAEIRDKKHTLSEHANEKRGEITLQVENEIETQNSQYLELDREKKSLTQRQQTLNAQINRTCCGFFSCCVREELSELKTIETQILEIDAKQRELTETRQHKDKMLVSIKDDLATLDAKLEKLSQTYLAQKDEDEKKRNEIKLSKNQMQLTLNQAKTKFYSAVNIETILSAVRAYVRFTKLEQTVETLWAKHFAEKKGEPTAEQLAHSPKNSFTKLINLRRQLAQYKTQIEPLFHNLWCPDSGNRTSKAIYLRYLELNDAEQQLFLSGKADAKLKSKLALYEKLTEPTSPTLFETAIPNPAVAKTAEIPDRFQIFGMQQ